MFLNIQIDLLILNTYDGQFTLTTNHIIFNTLRGPAKIKISNSVKNVSYAQFNKAIAELKFYQ